MEGVQDRVAQLMTHYIGAFSREHRYCPYRLLVELKTREARIACVQPLASHQRCLQDGTDRRPPRPLGQERSPEAHATGERLFRYPVTEVRSARIILIWG